MLKNKIFLLFVTVFTSWNIFSQIDSADYKNQSFMNRVTLGGNLGLQFGTYTFIDISPLAGYNVNESVTVGAGFTYIYFRDNVFDYSTNIYGGRVFLRYYFLNNLFAHSEYEILNLENFYKNRINVTSLFIGGGFRQEIGLNSYGVLMVLYNINDSPYSPYSNPIIRGGIAFGL